MRPFLFLLLPLSTACAPLAGTWTGSCEIDDGKTTESYDVQDLALEGSGSSLTGTATVLASWQDFQGTIEPFEGTVTGTHTGSDVSLQLDLGDVVQSFQLFFDGTLDGETIEGTCAAQVTESRREGVGQLARAAEE